RPLKRAGGNVLEEGIGVVVTGGAQARLIGRDIQKVFGETDLPIGGEIDAILGTIFGPLVVTGRAGFEVIHLATIEHREIVFGPGFAPVDADVTDSAGDVEADEGGRNLDGE